jgi:hypothetical protein
MPITRTVWIDDDGTGTTGTVINNAEKQLIYDQIDAFVGGNAISFPLTDASGAGLGSLGTGLYTVLAGKTVMILAQPIWPVTANGAAAKVGGLPFSNSSTNAGLFQAYGVQRLWWIKPGDTQIECLNPATSVAVTNAQMSGTNNVLIGFYQAL